MHPGEMEPRNAMTMPSKRLLFIASGWTACTAAAFWAGTHFSGSPDAAGPGKSGRSSAFSTIQSNGASAQGKSAAGAAGAAGAPIRAAT